MTNKDVTFGEATIRQGWVTQAQLGECMAELQQRTSQGEEIHLSEVMVQRGLIDSEQASTLTATPLKRLLHCKQCKKTYRVLIAGAPPCKTCGGPLIDVSNRPVRPSARTKKVVTRLSAPKPPRAPEPPNTVSMMTTTKEVQLPTPKPVEPRTDPSDHLVGKLFSDKYELIGRIGHGAMGAVYQARHVRLERLCAVKILPQELARDPELMDRFRREAKTTARLEHINVVRVYEVNCDLDYQYLAMEYIEGVTLDQLLERQKVIPWREAVDMARQAATGLAVAHAKNVIHRDIKPANLMLNSEGTVKVMDFGLARLIEGGHQSQSGTILGTPHFMSPEQARGDPVDLRTDIYSLGASLYNMVTGSTPFAAPNSFALLLKAMEEEPVPAHQINRTLPEEVSAVILKMMSKNPDLRYPDMAAVIEDLEHLLAGQSGRLLATKEQPPPTVAQGRQPPTPRKRKIKMLWILLACNVTLVLTAAILVGTGAILSNDPTPSAPPKTTAEEAAEALLALREYCDRSNIAAEDKASQCSDYLLQYPDSPKGDVVREWRDMYRRRAASQEKTAPGNRFPREPGKTETPRRDERGRSPSKSQDLWQQLEAAKKNDDKVQGRELLKLLKNQDADPLDLEAYEEWLKGGGTRDSPGAMSPRQFSMLAQQIRDTLLEGRLDQARKMLVQLRQAKKPSPLQMSELNTLTAVLEAWKDPNSLSPQKALLALDFCLELATRRLGHGNAKQAEKLLQKALTLTRNKALQAKIHIQLAKVAEQLGQTEKVLSSYDRAWDCMLREPDFVERYSWALFSRRRYRKSLKCLRILKDDDQGPFLRSYMMLIAHFKSNDRPASNHLARQLMAKGIPVPRTILDTLALMPKNYTDTLILKNGLRLSGKLVSQSDSMISFRWREGTSTRFNAFKRDKVEQVTPGSMTRALFKQALEQHKKKTIQELQGLAHWARLNQRTASDIQLLERRIRFCRTTLRVKAGLACPACDATGFQTFRCNTCEGSGKVKKECESCNGKGWPPCSRCSGQGREQCPGCKGKGSRTVRVKTSSGYRNKNNQCGDCRGNKSIRCLRCQGDKHRRCSNCKGAGKHPRICSDCKGRKEHPCSACRGTGTHVGAWAAFVLGTGCHLAGDKEGAARFWLALEKNRASLTPARRLLILDQLHHLGLDILREKLGQ